MSGEFRAAVLTVSTSRAGGGGEQDRSGPALAEGLEALGVEVAAIEVVGDELEQIVDRLRAWVAQGVDLIATTGGTGLTPDDVTPEASAQVIERAAPGIPEAMRAASRSATPTWWLSRATAGLAGRTLIVNFPGSPKAVTECLEALAPGLPHALAHVRGEHAHG